MKQQPDSNNIAVHKDPVWRDRADFIIVAEWEPNQWEQLWARQLADDQFEICCIPFFTYDLSLGDLVETEARGDKRYVIRRVLKRSEHYVFRVWFANVASTAAREEVKAEVVAKMNEFRCVQEWSSSNLLAVATTDDMARMVGDYLQDQQDRGRLVFESAWT